jgi:hypothetical protein
MVAGQQQREQPEADGEVVAGDDLGAGGQLVGPRPYEPGRADALVDQGVVGEKQAVHRPVARFGPVADDHRVAAGGALGDHVAGDHRDAALGKLEFVGGRALGPVGEQVVAHLVQPGPALDQVPAVAALQVAAFEHEMLDPPHIQQVVQPELVVGGLVEGAVDDAQLGVVEVGGQDAVLVVLETAVADFQRALLHADAGAIAIGHAGAAEGDVVHLKCPFTNTQIPLPSASRPSAWSTGRVPRPRISRDFWGHTATSPR